MSYICLYVQSDSYKLAVGREATRSGDLARVALHTIGNAAPSVRSSTDTNSADRQPTDLYVGSTATKEAPVARDYVRRRLQNHGGATSTRGRSAALSAVMQLPPSWLLRRRSTLPTCPRPAAAPVSFSWIVESLCVRLSLHLQTLCARGRRAPGPRHRCPHRHRVGGR